MPERGGGRRYPRMARVNELLREVIADELERMSDADERLLMLTVTGVDADSDLSRARVMLSSLPPGAEDALEEHRVQLQRSINRQARLKRTPQLSFGTDPAVESGTRVEDILRDLRTLEGGADAGG
ncbi:MAG TPA: ribosome-binding factor A [Acidimicrobiales bacterium]|nr:ribosome-binding factor A [Acidimicrobiales bacterium]